jgi:hypothetical protein
MAKFKILLQEGRWDTVESGDREQALSGREGVSLIGTDARVRIKCFNRNGSVDLVSKRRKTELMISSDYDQFRTMSSTRHSNHFGGFTWPLFTAYDDQGEYVGYGMLNLVGTKPLDHYHSDTNAASNAATLKDRLRICAILSLLFKIAHEVDICIGDARPANIHVKRSEDGWLVYIIDTDSFQIANGIVLTSDVGADEHSSPRLLKLAQTNRPPGYSGLLRTPQDDNHALAVTCFQTLLQGHHPFSTSGRDRDIVLNVIEGVFPYGDNCRYRPKKSAPVAEYRALPAELRAMFEAVFRNGSHLSAANWAGLFHKLYRETPDTAAVRMGPRRTAPLRPTDRPRNNLSERLNEARHGKPGPLPAPVQPVLDETMRQVMKVVAGVLISVVVLMIILKMFE